jgi:geranylgeranyl diphosphate synthase, type I
MVETHTEINEKPTMMANRQSLDVIVAPMRLRIEKYICDFIKSARYGYTSEKCSEMSLYQLGTGGKRLRALIPTYIFAAFKQNPDFVIPLSAAIETIHNATLVHDDLQDGDELRRGKPTVWSKYGPAQAINCGDAMFYYALQMLDDLDATAETKLICTRMALQMTLQVIEGQAQEFVIKDEVSAGLDRYLGVTRGKTSGLFSLPILATLELLKLRIKANRSSYDDTNEIGTFGTHGTPGTLDSRNAPETLNTLELLKLLELKDVRTAIEQAATDLGVFFQIQDDLLDIYGQKQRERTATDIAEGKISVLVALLNDYASARDQAILSNIIRKPRELTSDSDINVAIDLFSKYDAKTKAFQILDEIRSRISSNPTLEKIPILQQLFVEFCDMAAAPLSHVAPS